MGCVEGYVNSKSDYLELLLSINEDLSTITEPGSYGHLHVYNNE